MQFPPCMKNLSGQRSGYNMSVRFAFLGCGLIARHHLRALQESRHSAEVVAVVDSNRRHAEDFVKLLPSPEHCKVFDSLPAALAWGEFDATVVMVPHHLHEPMASQCLVEGKHVLLEKPLAHTVEACVRLLEVSEQSDRVFMVGENSQFWPEVLKAKELVERGEIGEMYFAQANYWESLGSASFVESVDPALSKGIHWRCDPSRVGGGVLMDGATHWVRPLRMWLGEVEEVVGSVGHPFLPIRGETLAHAMLRFKGGRWAVLHCHMVDIPLFPLPFFQIFGSKGEITIAGSFGGGLSVQTQANPERKEMGSLGGYLAAFSPQMERFLEAVVGGGRVGEASAQEALQEVLVANAVYKSLQTKRWERVTVQNLIGVGNGL